MLQKWTILCKQPTKKSKKDSFAPIRKLCEKISNSFWEIFLENCFLVTFHIEFSLLTNLIYIQLMPNEKNCFQGIAHNFSFGFDSELSEILLKFWFSVQDFNKFMKS